MLFGILNSPIPIQVNINIIRAFIAICQLIFTPPIDKIFMFRQEIKEFKEYIEEMFADQNDSNS
ncbi:hypothetical protein CE91St19_00150 [Odoribacter laneus]|nr:hypothetical protein CE91St19_00150 [Odoribacter laneus]GKI23878.1 hypothetical protein CE91St20_00150 [Odoribacter laneus]